MMLQALYGEALRYLYVVSTAPVWPAIVRGALAALAGTFVLAAWRLCAGALRSARPAAPRRENA
jgi:hypothetical protein